MSRAIAVLLMALTPALVGASAPYHAGGPPSAQKAQTGSGDSRKLIEEIQADFDRAATDLNRNDPSAQTRQAQKRIIDGIDKLLERPEPPAKQPSNSPAPRSPNARPKTPPPPSAQPAMKQPQRKPAVEPAPRIAQKIRANTPAASSKNPLVDGPWPNLPPRHRGEVDAHARERFIRNYDALLREYYRALSENDRGPNKN